MFAFHLSRHYRKAYQPDDDEHITDSLLVLLSHIRDPFYRIQHLTDNWNIEAQK
jgi:hypothetical protein